MSPRIKVLHILANLGAGGAERMVVHIVRGLNRKRFDAAVVCISKPFGTDLEQVLAEDGIKVWYLGKGSGFDPRIYPKIHLILKDFQPDVVHTHVHVMRYVLPSMLYFKPALMLHTVNNLAEYEVEPRAYWLQRFAFNHGVVPIAVADEVAISLQRLYGIERCRVVLNCIPTSLYSVTQTPKAEWRAKQGFRDDDVLLGCVARFASQKNHALLIDAFAQVAASHPRAHLVLAGTGELLEAARTQATQLGLVDRVHFLGLRTDIPDTLGALDIFVLSSDYEGNPLSVIEAMAAGLPIVSTAAGGVPELIENGKQGFVVQPGDLKGLAGSMAFLLHEPRVRKSMGAAAARRAKEKFDVSVMVKAYEELYETLPAQRHGRKQHNFRRESVVAAGVGRNR